MTRGPSTEVRVFRAPSPADTAGVDVGLAALAFGSVSRLTNIGQASGPGRHLVFLPTESLALDLTDPAQRAFGDYELLEMMGQGGMGVVYRARQASLDREVAVKLLSAGPWASADFIERFKREAQAAARMQHPNIVAIYEIGAHEELNFFSMRLVRGGSLAKVLQERRTLPPREAAKFLRTVAEALDYAHRLGVLHLDLKPGNVLLDGEGEPQVVDFGLARRLDESLSADSDEVSGTPSYMAPEQAQLNSHKLSPATDIYGLGGILYECLTGRPPFLASTAQETLRHVVTRDLVAPRELDPKIPRDLEAVCLKCLAKDPRERYQTAREFAEDLGHYIEGRAVTVRPLNVLQRGARWARREPRVAGTALLLLLTLIVGFGATALQWRRAEYNATAASGLLWESRREAAVRLQKDGKGFEALPQLLLNIAEQEGRGNSGNADMDRRRAGALVAQGATLIDTMVITEGSPLALSMSPSGRTLAIAFNDLSVRWYDTASLSEVDRVELEGRPTSVGERAMPMLLRFLDERRLRVTLEWYRHYPHPSEGDSHLIDLERGALVEPPAEFADLADINYSADGRHALLRNRHDEIQFWQVEPWRALSARAPAPVALPWLLGRDGRFAAALGVGMGSLEWFDPRDLASPRQVLVERNVGISAWRESGDGKTLALGDHGGKVMLLDTETLAVRLLQESSGHKITWLAFSEDDAWLAAGEFNGVAHVYDVRSLENFSAVSIASNQIQHGGAIGRVDINRREGTLLTSGPGGSAIWRIGGDNWAYGAANRLGTGPTGHDLSTLYTGDWSTAAGLFASVGLDGQVRLWRMPPSTRLAARSADQIAEQLFFDGERVVDVEANHLRVVGIDGTVVSDWIALPQHPGFAELVDKGRSLIVTTALDLRVYDATTLRLRFAPLPLPGSPQRLVASEDGAITVLTYPDSGPNGFIERLEVFDTRAGRRLPGTTELGGPLRLLKLSPDSSRLLATGERNDATVVLETRGLKRIAEYPHDETAPVLWASFALDSNAIWLVVRDDDPRLGADALMLWDPSSDVVREERALPVGRPFAVLPTPGGPFVVGFDQDVLDPGGRNERVLERETRENDPAALALSPDGRVMAYGSRAAVQLYEVASAKPVGAPLMSVSTSLDVVAQLAFSPDGRWLLARTALGRWELWPIPRLDGPVDDAAESLTWMGDASDGHGAMLLPTPEVRARLRHQDPGAWHASAPRPQAVIARAIRGGSVPARDPTTDPLLLDLTESYNLAKHSFSGPDTNLIGESQLTVGLIRLKGVAYDVRGAIQLHYSGSNAGMVYAPQRVGGIAVPAQSIAALHVLMFAPHQAPQPEELTYAQLRLHYRDGGEVVLPIRTQREVPGSTRDDRPVPLAWAANGFYRLMGFSDPMIYSDPRLENPHPDRLIASIDLEASQETLAAPVFLAITAEPVIPTPESVTQVMRGAKDD